MLQASDDGKQETSPGDTSLSKPTSFPELTPLFSVRYATFFVMEAAFTALAWYCYHHPRALPNHAFFDYLDFGTIKSGFIVVFNLWHTIAIACAIATCAQTFSGEWAAREKRTDEVSTITSGILDRVFYSFKQRATKTFRAAFLIFLGLLVMRMIGSSIVTATDGVPSRQPLNIGLISTSSLTPASTSSSNPTFAIRLIQANMIVRLEQLLGSPWGYVPQPNWLIPLPTKDLDMTSQVEYETDLVRFQHTCQWGAPERYNGPPDQTQITLAPSDVTVGNVTWQGLFAANATEFLEGGTYTVRNGSSIIRLSAATTPVPGSSAYLFLGGNSSFPLNSTNPSEGWIDLSGLPTILNPDGFLTDRTPLPGVVRSPLATVLICDPQLQFLSGTVLLKPTSNLTEPDITVSKQTPSPSEHVGNIDGSAARTLFAAALSSAIAQKDPFVPLEVPSIRRMEFLNFNSVAAEMLLDLLPWMQRNWTTMAAVRPRGLSMVNQHVDDFTLSALKAFTSGYRGDANIQEVSSIAAKVVDAQYITTQLALATSIQFAILHSVLFVVMAFGLAALAYFNKKEHRTPFELSSIEKEYGEKVG